MGSEGTTTVYPSDGVGGATTTAGDGQTYEYKYCIVEGFTLLVHNAGEDLVLTDDAGTEIDTWTIPAAALVGDFIPFGIDGIDVHSGVGAELSTGSTARYRVYYRIIHTATYGQ